MVAYAMRTVGVGMLDAALPQGEPAPVVLGPNMVNAWASALGGGALDEP
jgi:hypothetical protein